MPKFRTPRAHIGAIVLVVATAAAAIAAPAAASVVTSIDIFTITRSGLSPGSPLGSYEGQRVLYRDDFGDGVAPPAGGSFSTSAPGTYGVLGSYPAGAEAGGRLALDSSHGGDFINAQGGGRTLQRSVLLTDIDANSPAGLKPLHTFAVYGLFDWVLPPLHGDGYGVLLNDGGPAGASISLDLFVRRELNGNVVVRFQEQDFINSVIDTLELDVLVVPPGADQIELRLERADLATSSITAAYRFWDDGAALSPFTVMTTSVDFFTRNAWARGGYFAVEMIPVAEPGTLALLLWPAALGLLAVWHRRVWRLRGPEGGGPDRLRL